MDFRATLLVLERRFAERGCRWAVIGGVAMGFYGVPRATVDVDILADGAFAPLLDEMLGDLGYRLEYRWEESSHFAPTAPERCPLDVLHARRPHTLGMLARARLLPLGGDGPAVPVVDAEDLVGLKVQAMVNDPERRRGELVDIRALFEAAVARGVRLDRRRIEEYFAIFGERAEFAELSRGVEDAFA